MTKKLIVDARIVNGRIIKRTVGRNQPCPCGSGKKMKRCCGGADNEKV